MITAIRKSLQKGPYKNLMVIVFVIIMLMFLLPSTLRYGGRGGDSWLIKINGSQVPFARFSLRTQVQEERISVIKSQYGAMAELFMQAMGLNIDPKTYATDSVVREVLLDSIVRKLNINVAPYFVEEKMMDAAYAQKILYPIVPISFFDPNAGLRGDKIRYYLQKYGSSLAEFDQELLEAFGRLIVEDIVKGASVLPGFVLQEHYKQKYLAKKFSLLHFDFEQFLAKEKEKKIEEKDLQEFFAAGNKKDKQYWIPTKRSGKAWIFTPKTAAIVVDEDLVKEEYNNQKGSKYKQEPAKIQVRKIVFTIPDKKDAEKVKSRAEQVYKDLIAKPETFAQVAQTISEDKTTAKDGGLVPFFERGQKDKAFDMAAFALPKDGAISEVIKTSEGYVILQRVAKKDAVYKSFDEVAPEIRSKLMLRIFKERFVEDARALIERDVVDEQALNNFIKTAEATKDIALIELDKSKESQALFRPEKKGAYSFYIEEDKGYLVQVGDIKLSYEPSLGEVKDIVMQDMYEERANQSLRKTLKQAKLASAAKTMAQLQQEFGGTLTTTDFVKEGSDKLQELKKKSLPVERLLSLTLVGSVIEAPVGLDAYLIRMDELEAFKEEDFIKEKDNLLRLLSSSYSRLLNESFIDSLKRNAKIEINDQVLNRVR